MSIHLQKILQKGHLSIFILLDVYLSLEQYGYFMERATCNNYSGTVCTEWSGVEACDRTTALLHVLETPYENKNSNFCEK